MCASRQYGPDHPGTFTRGVTGSEAACSETTVLVVGDVDCVVSDYEMPAMNGLELLGAVRESDPTASFVLFTACDDETLARRARDRDAAYLRKDGPAGGFERLSESVADALAD